MARAAHPQTPWGPRERHMLATAIRGAEHTQAECARALVEKHGATHASQALVSRWVSGKIETPVCVDAILAYCQEHSPVADSPPPPTAQTTQSTPPFRQPTRNEATEVHRLRQKVDDLEVALAGAKDLIEHLTAIDRLRRDQDRVRRELDEREAQIQEHRDAIDQINETTITGLTWDESAGDLHD